MSSVWYIVCNDTVCRGWLTLSRQATEYPLGYLARQANCVRPWDGPWAPADRGLPHYVCLQAELQAVLQRQRRELHDKEFSALVESGLNPYEVFRRRDMEAEVSVRRRGAEGGGTGRPALLRTSCKLAGVVVGAANAAPHVLGCRQHDEMLVVSLSIRAAVGQISMSVVPCHPPLPVSCAGGAATDSRVTLPLTAGGPC